MAKTLNDYLKTFEKDYFNNAVDSVIFDNSNYAKISRYKSWDHCYIFFCDLRKKYSKPEDITEEDMNLACLNLAFYLASWGMYRGSGAIYNFDYTIYEKVIKTLFDPYYEELWYLDDTLRSIYFNNKNDIEKLFCCKNDIGESVNCAEINNIVDKIYMLGIEIEQDLRGYYIYDNDKYYFNETGKKKDFWASDTLITKIMLGTMGCMPGFDKNFKIGIDFSKSGVGDFFEKRYIKVVLLIAIINLNTLVYSQNYIKISKYQYPFMKLLDIYYFTRGAEKDLVNYMEMAEEEIKKRTYSNYSDWFKSLPPNDKKPSTVTQIKVTKAISQVCYSSFNGYEINSAISQERELGEFIRGIVNEKENEERMRKYIKEKNGKDKDLND